MRSFSPFSKTKSKGRSKRSTPLYSDISVYSQEGTLLFRCSKKKANWYLSRNLAKRKWLKKKSIQLKFEAGGLGDPPEILAIKRKNQCAECGCKNLSVLSKHHIVPYSFRKFLNRDRQSILVVPLCFDCHDKYEIQSNKLRKELCEKYEVDMNRPDKLTDVEKLIKKIYSSNEAFSNKEGRVPKYALDIISAKINKYKAKYLELTGKEFQGNEKVREIKTYNYSEAIVEKLDTEEKVLEFERIWIKHFLEHMSLKYLDPKHIEYLKSY